MSKIGSWKMIASYGTVFLIFMSTTRLVVENQPLGLPLSYLNFSNLITYVLDLIYGLNLLFIVIALLFILKGPINFLIETRIRRYSETQIDTAALWLIEIDYLLWVILWFVYYGNPLNRSLMVLVQFVLFAALVIPLLILRYSNWSSRNSNVIGVLLMIFIFTWCYTKTVTQIERINLNSKSNDQTRIVFKDNLRKDFQSSDTCFYITNTTDFVFIFNSHSKAYTAFPMSEIFSITHKGIPDSLMSIKIK